MPREWQPRPRRPALVQAEAIQQYWEKYQKDPNASVGRENLAPPAAWADAVFVYDAHKNPETMLGECVRSTRALIQNFKSIGVVAEMRVISVGSFSDAYPVTLQGAEDEHVVAYVPNDGVIVDLTACQYNFGLPVPYIWKISPAELENTEVLSD